MYYFYSAYKTQAETDSFIIEHPELNNFSAFSLGLLTVSDYQSRKFFFWHKLGFIFAEHENSTNLNQPSEL